MLIYAQVLETGQNQILVKDCNSGQEVAVNLRNGCNFSVSDTVQIVYNGIMTMSIPPQISPMRITVINVGDAMPYLAEYSRILNTMINNMNSAELTDSISHNFIVQMIPHHQAAIEMSENILKYTDNTELTEIAGNIIKEQTESISNMQNILDSCACIKNTTCEVRTYQRNVSHITNRMFSAMSNAFSDNCVNCNFIREMIPHHEGAVRMLGNAFQFTVCPELRPILRNIITSQRQGINRMRCLANKRKCR